MSDTAVVYLFWGPLGIAPLERFAASYAAHPSGREHRLILLLKGVLDADAEARCRRLAAEVGGDCLGVENVGFDVDAYRWAAEHLTVRTLCFLNTASEILADAWLRTLATVLTPSEVGLVGATASNETLLSSVPAPLRALMRHRHPPFPNPHLRSNAFMLERELLLSLRWPATRRKRGAYELENGRLSITRQIMERGLQTLVVGRDGRGYGPESWGESHTFRSGSQENLLIADNRTRAYAAADRAHRAELARLAWGEQGVGDR